MCKKLKIVAAIVLSVCMMSTLCACGNPGPTETVDKFLSAVKAQDQEKLSSVYAGKNFNILGIVEDEAKSIDSLKEKQITEKLLGFDYKISNEKINDTKASVDVEFKTYEVGKAIANAISKYLKEALPLAFSGASNEEMEKIMNDAFEEEFNALTDKTYTGKATIKLVQKDGQWKVAKIDEKGKVVNAMYGNLINALKKLN